MGRDANVTDLANLLDEAEELLRLHRFVERRGSETLLFHYAVTRTISRRSSPLGKIADELNFSLSVEAGARRLRGRWLGEGIETVESKSRELGLPRGDVEVLRAVAAYFSGIEE